MSWQGAEVPGDFGVARIRDEDGWVRMRKGPTTLDVISDDGRALVPVLRKAQITHEVSDGYDLDLDLDVWRIEFDGVSMAELVVVAFEWRAARRRSNLNSIRPEPRYRPWTDILAQVLRERDSTSIDTTWRLGGKKALKAIFKDVAVRQVMGQ